MIKTGQTNRLIHEKSPYLLQHAYNPINWYPWCDEAFEKAKEENKPIFLSIGYSTCHWCHVMERESFEDQEVAGILNKNFISIKVDREERPDVDTIYMTVCTAMTGQGGWPLTIIMTPDKKPFFAGTYFPKNSIWGRPGLIEILEQVDKLWKEDSEKLIKSGENITSIIRKEQNRLQDSKGNLDEKILDEAFFDLKERFDKIYGGFGTSPKFPMAHNLLFLLYYFKKTGTPEALEMVEKTLDGMSRGGIFDHIGFGFSRYSTDEKWLVPHFEKMLYDNALLAYIYTEAYLATGNEKYKKIAKKIFTYVDRTMTSPEGGFYTAEDADSEGVEGKYYVWDEKEIIMALGPREGELFCKVYNITKEGNFEGKNIPNLIDTCLDSIAKDYDLTVEQLEEKLDYFRRKLFERRKLRNRPYKDKKILTASNGLMIAAFARGYRVFKDDIFVKKAENAVSFIMKNLVQSDGRLQARFIDDHATYLAYIDDYAFFTWGLIELYEATFKVDYLKTALKFTEDMLKLFWDDDKGGLFFYGIDAESHIFRPKEIYDGATPSGNSVAAYNLLRLARMTGNSNFEEKALNIFETFAKQVQSYPSGHTFLLTAYLFAESFPMEIVLVGNPEDCNTKSLINKIHSSFLPNAVLVLKPEGDQERNIVDLIPFIKNMEKINGQATVYICKDYACRAPVNSVEELEKLI